jgi:hypothetical protein
MHWPIAQAEADAAAGVAAPDGAADGGGACSAARFLAPALRAAHVLLFDEAR